MSARQKLSDFTTDRPVAVLVVFLAAVVFGYFSLQRLPVALMPELTYPTLTVRTEYPGTAPQEVENEISRPIEERLGVVSGLREISSISRPGVSDVVLEFTWGTDMDDATQEVLEKIDQVLLPQEAERPLLLHFDPSLDPIMELSFSGKGERFEGEAGLRRLRRIADLRIKRQLEPIKGVAAARVRGGLEEEIQVLLDGERLSQTGVTIQEVMSRLSQENINVAGGLVNEGRSEYMVRAVNEYANISEIAETVVRRDGAKEIRVGDLGRVVRSHKELEIITRADGGESVQIDIFKEADANIVSVANEIRSRLGDIPELDEASGAPQGPAARGGANWRSKGLAQQIYEDEQAILKVAADRSLFIKQSINEVRSTAIIGGALAILALFVFLKDLRSTAIVAVSIPISIIVTFAPLNLSGVSLNIMSLGGLALGVGMLVDSSIVTLESIFRCREEGDDIRTSAVRGTREVRSAIVASTLTSVAVFFPMVFVEGIAGQAFSDLGLAVVTSLIASLIVAIYFIPMLASRRAAQANAEGLAGARSFRFRSWCQLRDATRWMGRSWRWILFPYFLLRFLVSFVIELFAKLILTALFLVAVLFLRLVPSLAGLVARGLGGLFRRRSGTGREGGSRLYTRLLVGCLNHAGVMVVLTVLTLWGSWEVAQRLDAELLPEVFQGEFTIEAELPIGTPIERTREVFGAIEREILEDKGNIESLLVTYGYDSSSLTRSDDGEHSAKFKVLLQPSRDLEAIERGTVDRLRAMFADLPGVTSRVKRPVLFSSKTPIEIEIHGDDLDRLGRLSKMATARLRELPSLADVEPTLRPGAPEIQVVYDREQVARFGMNVNGVATQIRSMVKGSEATKFNLKDRRIPIVVRLEEEDRKNVEDIADLQLMGPGGSPIKVRAIAELIEGVGPSEIRRIDGRRVAVIEANLGAGALSDAVAEIDNELSSGIAWGAGTRFEVTGQNREWKRSEASLFLALGLSVFLVYVIMASQFESLIQPLIIMFSIPLAFFGAFVGLYIFGIPLSIVVFLGMIMLAGIVVNNAIVLVDYTNQLVRRGEDLREAVIQAARVRLRPILMTTATTVLGLGPMAFGMGEGAEIRAPMAMTVIFGLTASTVLTLGVIPTLYYVVARWNRQLFVPTKDPLEDDESVSETIARA